MAMKASGLIVKGNIIKPPIMNLIPAKWIGVSNCKPTLIVEYTVDHKRQHKIAIIIVLSFFIAILLFG
jgi:hypothetical protein